MRRCTLVTVVVCVSEAAAAPLSSARRGLHGGRQPYRSTTPFKLQPHEVNETNVPSAREVASMIPSLAELRRQLSSARELEEQYVRPSSTTTTTTTRQAATHEPPLWPNSDTVEDIMDEERYGSEEGRDLVPPPSPQHVLLAWKALLWGTVYAVLGVAVVVCVAMYASGMHCLSEVFVYLRGREDRARRRLEESGEDVSHYVLDLTNPSTVIQQAQDIWKALEALAEDEGESTREKKE